MPWIRAYIEVPSPVPWEEGMLIRAGLTEQFKAGLTKKDLKALFSEDDGATLLAPAKECGLWELVPHRRELEKLNRYTSEQIEEKLHKIPLSEVTEARVMAAPVWFTVWVLQEIQEHLETPPEDLWEYPKNNWGDLSLSEKTEALMRYCMYFGGENGSPIAVDSAETLWR